MSYDSDARSFMLISFFTEEGSTLAKVLVGNVNSFAKSFWPSVKSTNRPLPALKLMLFSNAAVVHGTTAADRDDVCIAAAKESLQGTDKKWSIGDSISIISMVASRNLYTNRWRERTWLRAQ